MTPPEPLSPRARSLLDAARDELGPDDAAIARMRSRVLAGTAAGGVGVAVAVKASGWGGTGAKLALALLVAAVLGGGMYLVTRDAAPSSPPAESAANPATAPSLPVSMETAPARPARPVLPPPETAVAPVTPAPGRTAAPVAPRPAAPPKRATAAAPGKGSSLADEVALVDDAMAALRDADPVAALEAADDHVTRFGRKGQLAEEAAAIRVEALCRLGDARWSAAFDDFDERYPRSAQRPRLSAACKGVQ